MSEPSSPGPLKVWRERDGRLLRLRLAQPKANIVDAAMIAALDTALSRAQGEAAIRAVLLDHEGPHFSFGASVHEHLPESFKGMLAALHRLVLRMVAYPVPILVAIKGQCLGGGLEVAASGHLLFASPDAKFGQPEIVLGVFAPAASCLLPERMGRALAEDLLFSGRSIDAGQAAHSGLLNAVADDPEAAALAWFDAHVAKHSASSLRFAVAASRQDMVERVRSKLARAETLYIDGLMSTRDAVEGLTAFLDKRAAHWEDR
ncbi:cyclohexa-1,5-dienecarbonyl-CoA hydratase [Azospirillum sp.]|uniref:cyclohexa-1,5-dienecarbonyl-CoA hydratase n=1 Tax=Azospirillum sp. TaxID=34012 RepID=UPI003D75E88C